MITKHKFNISIKLRFALYFSIFFSLLLSIFLIIAYYLYLSTNLSYSKEILQLQFINIKNSINYIGITQKGLELEDSAIDSIEKATNEGLLIFIFDDKGETLESPSSIDVDIPKEKKGYFRFNCKKCVAEMS